jgi:hypothetical protein
MAPALGQLDLANSPLSGSSMFAVKALRAISVEIRGAAPPRQCGRRFHSAIPCGCREPLSAWHLNGL